MNDWIGYRWLSIHYGLEPVQAFRIDSQIAKSRFTEKADGLIHEYYPAHFRPDNTLAGHLKFALKSEGVHLEFLSRLFNQIPAAELDVWIASEPTGQYARRAGFFYEWLTGNKLAFGGVGVGNYVDAIDEKFYLTATNPINNTRWRVRDNLPGTPAYCPSIYRTQTIRTAEGYDIPRHLRSLESEYGEDLLMRSAVWIGMKESLASFTLEHEAQKIDRVKRFAAATAKNCGRYDSPFSEKALAELQSEILGTRGTQTNNSFGIRKSPVFVGEVTSEFTPLVHYIAPRWDDVPPILEGMEAFLKRTTGRNSILRAGALSFGFVYIHPLSDGNGRISRFLINDTLRRDKALPEPFILPVSATIIASSRTRRAYDQILETFSKPFMHKYRNDYSFGETKEAADGIRHNLEFSAYKDALAAWRYPDLTSHVEYTAQVIDQTIENEMRNEAAYLKKHRIAREKVKEIVEGPDTDIDYIIRSVQENKGKISNSLAKRFPVLGEKPIAEKVATTVRDAFRKEESANLSFAFRPTPRP